MTRVVDLRRNLSKRERTQIPQGTAKPTALWRHRLSEDDYYGMLEAQGGVCAICGTDTRLVIDHDHGCCSSSPDQPTKTCGLCVRGLVCYRCNLALGMVEAIGPASLVRALRYIDGHNARGVGLGGPGGFVDRVSEYLTIALTAEAP